MPKARAENHGKWAGDSVAYNKKHDWIRKNWKLPLSCEHCNLPKKLEWANKSGKYLRSDRADWLALCRSCHTKMDMTDQRRANMSTAAKIRANRPEEKARLKQISIARHNKTKEVK